MFKNHFNVAIRNIWRNKVFSLIHILGLSIGISASLVIFLIVKYELSFDRFEASNDRIYRIVMDFKFNGQEGHGPAVPAALPNAIQNEVTGVEANVPIMQFQGDGSVQVTTENSRSKVDFKHQPDVVFTSPDYFEMLTFTWLIGSPANALNEPFSVVLTESRAKQYFPDHALTDIPGKQLTYNDNLKVTVTGVVKDLEEITDFTAAEFISYSTISKTSMQNDFMMEVWNDWMAYSKAWIKLSPANDRAGVEAQINTLLNKYNKDASRDANNYSAFKLQPLSDVHFNTTYAGFGQRTADAKTLYGLLAIAAFLLLLGCINFINLSTAQASQRAKEIGIRKTIGGTRKQLVFQFLSETMLVTLLATIVSICTAPILLQVFADFIPNGVRFDIIQQPSLLLFPVVLILVVSIFAGLYPAAVLSGFRPAAVLRNQAFAGSPTRSAGLRKVLTVSQFAIAQFFVIAAVMMGKQIHFSLNQDLGYRKDAIINFEIPRDTVASHVETLANNIKVMPGIQMVSTGFLPPAMEGAAFTNIKYNNGTEEISPSVQLRFGDPEFIQLYNIGLVAGRNVRPGKDVNEALINEAYAKALGFTDPTEALQKELINYGGSRTPIVGVMRDFHEGSFHQAIGPIVFKANTGGRFFHVALNPGETSSWQQSIASIQEAYNNIYPESEFKYEFFDDAIASFYQQEQNTSQLLNWSMGLSILISCLGLLGLVIYISEARAKEIGIRKILGASVANLVSILSREFIVLVLIAFAIAAPVAWYAIDQWLETFVYKTQISWWVFVVSGAALIVVAIITLGAHTIRTAMSNPVKSLRNE